MKYRQLTKEQFEELHKEFALFLASQKIDAKEWEQLKKEKPHVAEDELNIFSDVVWDDVLKKTQYIEHLSTHSFNLFYCEDAQIHGIFITIKNDKNLLEKDGYQWLLDHIKSDEVSLFTGTKKYSKERNLEIFDLIEKGGNISDGKLYNYFKELIS